MLTARSYNLASIFKMFRYVLAGRVPGGTRTCVMCAKRVWRYMPYRSGNSGSHLMSVLKVVGSDVKNFECPRCGAHDRERHLRLYMEADGVLNWMAGKTVLHFAPERRLSEVIKSAGPSEYTQCDLFPKNPNVIRIDMLKIDLASESVDLVVANHILEHVGDVQTALKELYRVLRPNGLAILQTPFSALLHRTWEDPGIDTGEARLVAYGQEDHVRLFGKDFIERVVEAGFKSRVKSHEDLLSEVDIHVVGVNPAEPFLLFERG